MHVDVAGPWAARVRAHAGPFCAALVMACTMLLPWLGPQRVRSSWSSNTIGTLHASSPAAQHAHERRKQNPEASS